MSNPLRFVCVLDYILSNEAYYPEYESWVKDLEWAGCGKFNKDSKGNFDTGVSVMLALEAGYKYRIKSNLILYGGVYLDCGLNNVAKADKSALINYDNRTAKDFTTNSVMTSFAEKAKVMAVGVKVHVAWIK